MTSREKLMLVVLAVGGLGAGGFVLYDNYTAILTAHAPGKPAEQTITEVEATLNAAKIESGRVAASMAAQMPVPRDFFMPMPKWLEQLNEAKTDKAKIDLQYTGYLAGAKILGIIGGTEYAEGDQVEGTNFKVKSVLPDHVILVAADGEETELPYQGEELLF